MENKRNQVQRLYSNQYNSYAEWNGSAWEDKKSNAYFYTLEKAANNGYYPEKSTREQALEWWENTNQVGFAKYYHGNSRTPHSLTGREIEEIWRKEVEELQEDGKKWLDKPNQKQFKQFDAKLFKQYIDKFSDEDLEKIHHIVGVNIGIRRSQRLS